MTSGPENYLFSNHIHPLLPFISFLWYTITLLGSWEALSCALTGTFTYESLDTKTFALCSKEIIQMKLYIA